MACHTVNMPFAGLGLRDPVSVVATTAGHNKDSYPAWSKIEFQFPATDKRPAVKFFWYDGGQRPADEVLVHVNEFKRAKKEKEEAQAAKTAKKGAKKVVRRSRGDSGCLIIGDKGQMYSPDDYGAQYELFGAARPARGGVCQVARTLRRVARSDPRRQACHVELHRLRRPAHRDHPPGQPRPCGWLPTPEKPGKKVEWDAKNLKALNAPEVAHIIQAEYRKGYSL